MSKTMHMIQTYPLRNLDGGQRVDSSDSAISQHSSMYDASAARSSQYEPMDHVDSVKIDGVEDASGPVDRFVALPAHVKTVVTKLFTITEQKSVSTLQTVPTN